MPSKKKRQAMQGQINHPAQGNADTEDEDTEISEETLEKMKEEVLKERPELKGVFQFLEKSGKEGVEQAQNSSVVFTNNRGTVTEELLMQYPNSPTAKQTMVALKHFQYAVQVLWSYPKPRVRLPADCDFVQPGLHHYMEGFMIAGYMTKQFPLPPTIENIVEDYLKMRPNDSLVEYFRVSIIGLIQARKKSDYESCKDIIRAHEIFAHKLLPLKSVETEKRILAGCFYMLGAKYTSTKQNVRALDAFENLYALDNRNIDAIYNVAFHTMEKEPERSLKLCHKYLDNAPKCDEKYPNVHYVMGFIYAVHFKNIDLAMKHYNLGQEGEAIRLPFNTPTDFPPKSFLESIAPIATVNRKQLQTALEHFDLH